MLSSHLSGELHHILDEPSHSVAVNFVMEFVVQNLHLGQTREGGGQQLALAGILPKQIHDFVVLLRHREEVMANIAVQGHEANVWLVTGTAQLVNASADTFRNLREASLGCVQGLWRSIRPTINLALPGVVILVEAGIQEDATVARELVAAPEDDEDIDGQRVLLVLRQLQTEGLDLGLHLIGYGYVAKRLTPEGRAHHFPVHVEPAVLLALLLEALG